MLSMFRCQDDIYHCFSRSGEIEPILGTFPRAMLSMSLLRSTTVVSASIDSVSGCSSHCLLSEVQVWVVFLSVSPSVEWTSPEDDLRGTVLIWSGPSAFFMPSHMPLLVRTVSGGLLILVPGSPMNVQVPLTWWPLVFFQGHVLGFYNWDHH